MYSDVLKDRALMLEGDTLQASHRLVLGQSLFYYCSGKDPTPINAFGADIPLYVYVDSLCFSKADFSAESKKLYARLSDLKHKVVGKQKLNTVGRLRCAENAELTLWKSASLGHFVLLFVQGDAVECYKSIYGENENFIVPKYICNYRYELNDPDILRVVEKRVEYILGHCFNDKYLPVECYDYLGDYGKEEMVTLYRRFFYYLY